MVLEQLFVFGSRDQGGGVIGLWGRGSTTGEGSRLDQVKHEKRLRELLIKKSVLQSGENKHVSFDIHSKMYDLKYLHVSNGIF